MSPRRESAAVAALLVVAAALLTWPLAARLDSAVIDLGDPLLHGWILAWDLHALATAPLGLFDANIFYPRHWSLAFSDHLLGLLPLAAPVGLAGGGPILVHNVVLFATFPLAGLTMFWLVRHLTGRAAAGLVAGALYAFSHYRLAQLSHVQILSHEWLPLVLLGLHRTVAGGGRWRDVALAALAVLLQGLSSGYHASLTAVALAVFAFWVGSPAGRPPLGRLARRGLVAGALTALALLPFFLPYAAARREFGLVRAPTEVEYYSAQADSYLRPTRPIPWLPALAAAVPRTEGSLFPGLVLVALAAGGVIAGLVGAPGGEPAVRPPGSRWPAWLDVPLAAYLPVTLADVAVLGGASLQLGPLHVSHRDLAPPCLVVAGTLLARRALHGRAVPLRGLGGLRRLGWPHAVGLYVGLAAVGILCSFGPTLRIAEQPVAWPLYRRLYDLVPGFDGLRVPARFAILASTGLAVLAGYGVAALLGRLRAATVRGAVVVALVALALLEVWAIPLPFRDVVAVGPADRWLAGAPVGPVAVLPFYPETEGYMEAGRLLGSTAHWRPLVNGYGGFFPPGYWETVEVLNRFPAADAVARLRALGVRYVVIHLRQRGDDAHSRGEAGLGALPPGIVRVAAFEEAVILEVR